MSFRVGGTHLSLGLQRQLQGHSASLAKSFERLSSGMRIVNASDDAAGLAVAQQLTTSARVFTQAIRNTSDTVSALQIADSSLEQLSNILTRQKELAAQAANGVFSLAQRAALDAESTALTDEYNRVVASTKFNGIDLLPNSGTTIAAQVGLTSTDSVSSALAASLRRTVGDGTLSAGVTLGPDLAYYGRGTTADFNADGKLDFVLSVPLSAVAIFQGNGDGTFKANVSYVAGDARDVTVGDVDSDGKLDLLANDRATGTVGILLGNGDGTFKARTSVTIGGNTENLKLTDFNGDGVLDIAVASSSAGTLNILLGNGNGTFKAHTSFAAGGYAYNPEIGDFNADGKHDVVISNYNDDTVSIFLGNGDGSFLAQRSFASGGDGPDDMKIGDLNNDGRQDLVISNWFGTGVLSTFLGNGDGTFRPGVTMTKGSLRSAVTLAEMNGDGIADIVTASVGVANGLSVFLGNIDGTFSARTSYGGLESTALTADFNNDGVTDVVAASSGVSPTRVQIRLGNTRTVTFTPYLDLFSVDSARTAMTTVDALLERVTSERGSIGASLSRLSHVSNVIVDQYEQYRAAGARITDLDVAEESANLVRTQILQNVSSSLLAQANQQHGLVLKLLGQ